MLLGLDLGTTHIKALVTDRDGRPLAHGSCPVGLSHVAGGGVEQDLEEIWQGTVQAIRAAVGALDPAGIQAVGVSSQGGALQVLDPSGSPQGRVISWLDQRGRPADHALTAELGRAWFESRIRHGKAGLAIGQLLRLRNESPGLLDPPNRIGFVGDVIVSRLCGRAAQDGTSCALTLLYDPARRGYAAELLARLGVAPEQLPALLPPREPAGGLTPQGAQATGLRAGIPVSAAIHDQYTAALAAGAVKAGTVMVGTGTAWVLLAVSDQLTAPVHEDAFVCHHVVDGLWGQIVSLVNGGSALTWALELTGQTAPTTRELDALLESAPPGSEGLRFWPFLTPFGASGLAPGTKGRLADIQLSHRSEHLLRAVVEGLAFELNRHLDFLRRAGWPVSRLVVSGSAAASRVTPQILADVTGLSLGSVGAGEGSPLGAAIVARGLLEPESSLAALAEAMARPARPVTPGQNAPAYQEQYRQYLGTLPLSHQDFHANQRC